MISFSSKMHLNNTGTCTGVSVVKR